MSALPGPRISLYYYANKRLFFGKSSLNEPSRFLHDIPEKLTQITQSSNIVHDLRRGKKSDGSDLSTIPIFIDR